jgi:hypothetical protein
VAASIADYRRSHRRTCPPPETAVVFPPVPPAEALPRSLVSMAICLLNCVTTRSSSGLRETRTVCDVHGDVATASLIERWISGAERYFRLLFESSRRS